MKLPQINLEIGQVIYSPTPIIIRTVVGACVSLTMFDKESASGAMCHALYPGRSESSLYSVDAAERMLEQFSKHNIDISNLEVKIFGAGNPLSGKEASPKDLAYSIDSVEDYIHSKELTFCAKDVGGAHSREIQFITSTGDVFIRYLTKSHLPQES